MVLLQLLGCLGTETPTQLPRPRPHFDEWAPLVAAALRGDLDTTRVMARTLIGPDDPDVGAARGYLLVADVDELPDALVRMAVACGRCHAGGVAGPNGREGAVGRLDQVVFGSGEAPAEGWVRAFAKASKQRP